MTLQANQDLISPFGPSVTILLPITHHVVIVGLMHVLTIKLFPDAL